MSWLATASITLHCLMEFSRTIEPYLNVYILPVSRPLNRAKYGNSQVVIDPSLSRSLKQETIQNTQPR